MQENKRCVLPKKVFGKKDKFTLSRKAQYYSCFEKCSKNSEPAVGIPNFDNKDQNVPSYESEEKNVLYIQPIAAINTYDQFGVIVDNLRKWLEAFYSPCKVQVLPVIGEYDLQTKHVSFKMNGFAKNQYNAESILKNVVGQIKNNLEDAVAVYTITDLDLYTNKSRNFVLGHSIPARGIIQSFHRFLPEFNFLT